MSLPRSLRRLAVVTMYGTYVAGTVMQWRVHKVGEDRETILALFLLSFAVGALLFVATHYMKWIGAKESALDEREIAMRNGIYRTAYSAIAWVSVTLLALWYTLPVFVRPLTPETNGNVLFWGYVLLLSTLPAALLAWKDRPAT